MGRFDGQADFLVPGALLCRQNAVIDDFAGEGGTTVFLGFGDSADDFTFPFTDRPFLGVPRAEDVWADDIDGDGDVDVVTCGKIDDTVRWFRNDDGLGTSWTPMVISTGADRNETIMRQDPFAE